MPNICKMSLAEAIRILDPATTREAIAEYEYYGGFKGWEASVKACENACRTVCDYLKAYSWQKGRPPKPGRYLCAIECPKGKWAEVLDYNENGTFTTLELAEDATRHVVAWKEVEPYEQSCKASNGSS